MRNKRGVDHEWNLVRYVGDAAIYAECKCGYNYSCGREERNEDGSWSAWCIPTIFYPYCPSCGSRKKYHSKMVKKILKHGRGKDLGFYMIYDMSEYFKNKDRSEWMENK